ncbi:hypothetical protein SSTU70S_02960 [Stutzerimonas stutzeri]
MPAASFSTYAADFEQVSTVLAQRGLARNVTAFWPGEDIVSLETAMHECGPMAWALILHVDALTRLCGLATSSISILPVTCVVNGDLRHRAFSDQLDAPGNAGFRWGSANKHCATTAA